MQVNANPNLGPDGEEFQRRFSYKLKSTAFGVKAQSSGITESRLVSSNLHQVVSGGIKRNLGGRFGANSAHCQ